MEVLVAEGISGRGVEGEGAEWGAVGDAVAPVEEGVPGGRLRQGGWSLAVMT